MPRLYLHVSIIPMAYDYDYDDDDDDLRYVEMRYHVISMMEHPLLSVLHIVASSLSSPMPSNCRCRCDSLGAADTCGGGDRSGCQDANGQSTWWSGHVWALGQLIAGGSTPDLETFDDDDLCDRPPPSPEASNSTHVWRVSV